jgi:two-component system, NarL family, sensor histidine kinase UhpB
MAVRLAVADAGLGETFLREAVLQTIVCGVDESPGAVEAIAVATGPSKGLGLRLVLGHVFDGYRGTNGVDLGGVRGHRAGQWLLERVAREHSLDSAADRRCGSRRPRERSLADRWRGGGGGDRRWLAWPVSAWARSAESAFSRAQEHSPLPRRGRSSTGGARMTLPDRSGSHMPLFWRVFLANAAILLAGILVLVLTPLSVSKHKTVPEIIVLLGGLALMIVANWLILRPLFRPLERLAGRMEEADVLRGGQRVPIDSTGEVGALEHAFNTMMKRLETERREAGARTLNAQEQERQRIARGLHDEIGQTMTGVLLLLKRLAHDATPEQRATLSEAQAAVKASLEDVRRTAQQLRPEILDHLGLPSALTNLARTFSDRTDIPVRRQLPTQLPRLDPKVELVLYRVAQEGLTNAARHSGASEVTLTLEHDADSVVLRIVDNGRGFDGSRAEGGGLRGIRERALIVGGAVAIKPAPTGGLEIRLQIPVAAVS